MDSGSGRVVSSIAQSLKRGAKRVLDLVSGETEAERAAKERRIAHDKICLQLPSSSRQLPAYITFYFNPDAPWRIKCDPCCAKLLEAYVRQCSAAQLRPDVFTTDVFSYYLSDVKQKFITAMAKIPSEAMKQKLKTDNNFRLLYNVVFGNDVQFAWVLEQLKDADKQEARASGLAFKDQPGICLVCTEETDLFELDTCKHGICLACVNTMLVTADIDRLYEHHPATAAKCPMCRANLSERVIEFLRARGEYLYEFLKANEKADAKQKIKRTLTDIEFEISTIVTRCVELGIDSAAIIACDSIDDVIFIGIIAGLNEVKRAVAVALRQTCDRRKVLARQLAAL